MNIIIMSFVILAALAAIAAITVYIVAKKFYVEEDPRIDMVNELLPGVNCGGCGFPGCRAFAEAIIKQGSLDGLNCPVGGADCMKSIAPVLGVEVIVEDPKIAVVRCSGSKVNSPRTVDYEGFQSCRFSFNLYTGVTGCPRGCVGLGSCVQSCQFDAMYIDEETGLPVIIDDKCVACGACVTTCPRGVIQLRLKGKKDRRIFVSCINKEKGALGKKHCSVVCIACAKCQKACPFGAITIHNNLAYIDHTKCKLCRKCAPECPTNAIHEVNFPERKVAEKSEVENE
ncbi:MAG: RnfABCDGE type electron transport complex subunit B [Bacteroidales bacterium]|nr:RnfABCDGE type electron transport complex subunit B [Bacteroidales bacterium]